MGQVGWARAQRWASLASWGPHSPPALGTIAGPVLQVVLGECTSPPSSTLLLPIDL